MSVGPRVRLEGVLPASPPRFSLLTVPGVEITQDPTDGRWLNGVEIEPEGCSVTLPDDFADLTAASVDYPYWWQTCRDGDIAPTTAIPAGTKAMSTTNPGRVTSEPYTVWTGYRCSTLDLHNEVRINEVKARLRRRLLACTPKAVEHEVWTGQVATAAGFPNPFLADSTAITEVLSGSQLGYVTALGELEQALAECGCSGAHIIHAQPRLVNLWVSEGLVVRPPTASHLETVATGTYVVPGTGYPGTEPDGAVPASYANTYAYGSGMIRVLLSPPRVPNVEAATVERTQQTVELRAERDVLHIFDDTCCLRGVQVLACDRLCGPAS